MIEGKKVYLSGPWVEKKENSFMSYNEIEKLNFLLAKNNSWIVENFEFSCKN